MMTPEQKCRKSFDLFAQLSQMVDEKASSSERIDIVERELFTGLLQLGRNLLEEFLVQVGDGDVGESLEHEDRTLKRLDKLSLRMYRSIFGSLKVRRRVYAVRERQTTVAPLDAKLGLPEREHSYVLQDFMQRFCVNNAFDESIESLEELFGLSVSKRTAEQLNQDFGEAIGRIRDDQKRKDFDHQEAEILAVSIDGKGVPMRGTVEQKRGQPETSMQKHLRKRKEAKAAVRSKRRRYAGHGKLQKQMAWISAVFTIDAARRTPNDILDEMANVGSTPRPKPVNKRIEAKMTDYIEGEKVNGQHMIFKDAAAQVAARDPESLKTLICLMDGQCSLWGLQAAYFPNAIPILDIFHASERLWKAAYCFHKENSLEADKFVGSYLRLLLEGKVDSIIRSFRARLSKLQARKRETLQAVIRYYNNNREIMKYNEYLANGYPIASGVIEGACRHLVNDRMERTGMRWQIDGAKAMLNTRSAYINGEWDSMIQERIKREQERLYGQAV